MECKVSRDCVFKHVYMPIFIQHINKHMCLEVSVCKYKSWYFCYTPSKWRRRKFPSAAVSPPL